MSCLICDSCADRYIQRRFYKDFPLKPEEACMLSASCCGVVLVLPSTHDDSLLFLRADLYKFQVGSSMKATQISTPFGSTNQIPGAVA
jgi:hypothetical protein